jgi:hypothetical protein
VIRTGKDHAHQGQDGVQKPFGLAERQVKEQPECERGLDGEIGIDRLGTLLAGLERCPGVDSTLTDSQRDVTAMAQGLIILMPIFDAIRRFIFGVALGTFVGFGHGGHRW